MPCAAESVITQHTNLGMCYTFNADKNNSYKSVDTGNDYLRVLVIHHCLRHALIVTPLNCLMMELFNDGVLNCGDMNINSPLNLARTSSAD